MLSSLCPSVQQSHVFENTLGQGNDNFFPEIKKYIQLDFSILVKYSQNCEIPKFPENAFIFVSQCVTDKMRRYFSKCILDVFRAR